MVGGRENMRFAEFFVNFVKIYYCKKLTSYITSLRIIVYKKKTRFQ
jgi:hypothetical protein